MIVGTIACCTSLMHASIGKIVAAGGQEFLPRFFTELRAIGAAAERGAPTEGEHMLGHLVALARKHGAATP